MATSKPQFFDTADPDSMLAPALEAKWSPEGAPLPPAPTPPAPRPHRIIVKAVNWLGDLVMSGPALHAIHDAFPGAHLAVLVRRELASFFDGAMWVDEVIPYRLRGGVAGLGDQLSIVRRIRAGHFDLAVVLPTSFQSAMELMAAYSGVPARGRSPGFMLTHKARRAPASGAHPPGVSLADDGRDAARGAAGAYHLDVNVESRDKRAVARAAPSAARPPADRACAGNLYGPAKE
jgi:heptosyltransferase-2